MTRLATNSYIERMIKEINNVLSQFNNSSPYAIVDFPDIRNVGDSAIWMGEITYFSRYWGSMPAYTSRIKDFDAARLAKLVPTGPILIHGGGNFGDIWPGHQRFREMLLKIFPDRHIIQLPQSIHYDSIDALKASAQIINSHANFTLLVRDKESADLAAEHFTCRTLLCPDMAFCIGPVEPLTSPSMPILAMLRTDKEQVSRTETPGKGIRVEDWITEPALPVALAKRWGALRTLPAMSREGVKFGYLDAAAAQRFRRGIHQLSRAEVVVTDRLHVHILSLLLGRPHAVLDNVYGKIGRFRRAFPEPEGLTYLAQSLDDGLAWAQQQVTAGG